MKKLILMLLLAIGSLAVFVQCREDKTAGEKVEESVEEVGEDIEEGAEEIEDEIDDATDDN